MGIYRTLLEEEVPHLDDNNNMSMDDIDEILGDTTGNAANDSEIERAQSGEFDVDAGGAADPEDLVQESFMAIYEMDSGFAQIMQVIGEHELNEAVAGREFFMEGPDIKGWFKTVKDKIVAFFKKVWQVLQRWASNFASLLHTNKQFASKYSAKIKEGYKICSASTYDGKALKGYKVDNKIENVDGLKDLKFDDISKDVAEQIRKAIENKSADQANALEAVINGETADAALKQLYKDIIGVDCSDNSDFGDKLRKAYLGEEPVEFWMTPDVIISWLTDKKKACEAVKKFQKNAKTSLKKQLDQLKRLETSASKLKAEEGSSKIMSACVSWSGLVRKCLSACHTFRTVSLSCINKIARQARRYGQAYVAAANKGKYKGFQKESANYGFLGSTGLV